MRRRPSGRPRSPARARRGGDCAPARGPPARRSAAGQQMLLRSPDVLPPVRCDQRSERTDRVQSTREDVRSPHARLFTVTAAGVATPQLAAWRAGASALGHARRRPRRPGQRRARAATTRPMAGCASGSARSSSALRSGRDTRGGDRRRRARARRMCQPSTGRDLVQLRGPRARRSCTEFTRSRRRRAGGRTGAARDVGNARAAKPPRTSMRRAPGSTTPSTPPTRRTSARPPTSTGTGASVSSSPRS